MILKSTTLTIALLLLTACTHQNADIGIDLNPTDQWAVKEKTSNSLTIETTQNFPKEGSYMWTQGFRPQDFPKTSITLKYFTKSQEESIEKWVEKNKSNFKMASFEGKCEETQKSVDATLYSCGRWTQDYYLVNKEGTKIAVLFLGQDPILNDNEMFSLVSFK